jgi:hypothetical protein
LAHDKQIGAGGILLEADNGGALNLGSYLHPLRKIEALRGHDEYNAQLGEYLRALPEAYDLEALTTLPHTMPGGLLGAWEFYLGSGDREFLREALGLMREAEAQFSRHALDCGLCTARFVDEFDYSLRLKPFIREFTKGDPELMLKMDTPLVPVDYNCYLHALRERILQAANVLEDASVDRTALREKNTRLAAAIQQYLWDEAQGFFFDADPRDLSRSPVKCIAGFAPLYAGLADERQAARLVEHLTNPAEFGTPYPCPSISMDTPEVDPSLITYGGDCLVTTGIWFTVEGLVRYGYHELAVSYLLRTLEMMTRGGPSSSYSYHCLTGEPNQSRHTLAAQSLIVTDLLCKYLIGLVPAERGELRLQPLALAASGVSSFRFGPCLCAGRCLTVTYDEAGYRLEVTPRR